MAAASVFNSTIASDQEKFLAAKLIARATLKMVAASLCEKIKQPNGTGLVAYFVRYSRMNVPLTTLSEGVTGTGSALAVEQFSVTLDQWGDFVVLTDVAELTAKHPLAQQAMEVLADNAQRVIDREIQKVWIANTNVQYGDGSVTTRDAITSAMKLSGAVIQRARVTMKLNGAPERGGPADQDFKLGAEAGGKIGNGNYVAVCGPELQADLMAESTSFGTFVAVETYRNNSALYAGEVGTWLGCKWVITNFIPVFRILGNYTAAAAIGANAGGITGMTTSVGTGTFGSVTLYWKVTRKSLTRGFEEYISVEHSTATGGASSSLQFVMPSTVGFVYNIYLGSTTGDANLKLAVENAAASSTNNITAVSSSTTTPPVASGSPSNNNPTVHPLYLHAADSCKWVGLQDLRMLRGGGNATESDPLAQRKTLGYKFYAKAIVADTTRLLRCELYSAQS